jgi:predicted site-specific integrase-resolvase
MIMPKEMAKRLGITVKTLQRWDKGGVLEAHRTPTNRRYYTEEQYLECIHSSSIKSKKHVAYARVSNAGQKDDLKNQIDFLRNYANGKGLILSEVVKI